MVVVPFDCGTRILRVIPRAGRPCHSSKLHHYQLIGAPAGIRTPNQQIMSRFEGHQQGETKRDNPVFTESAAVKVSYVWSRLSTPSRHNRAILCLNHAICLKSLMGLPLIREFRAPLIIVNTHSNSFYISSTLGSYSVKYF